MNRRGKREEKRRVKKGAIKKAVVKMLINLVFFILKGVILASAVLLFFGTVGAVLELCNNNKLFCGCYFIVASYVIARQVTRELMK